MNMTVGEIEVTKEILDKLGVDEAGFGVLESSEQQRLLDSIGIKQPAPKSPAKKEGDDTQVSGLLKDLQEERTQRQSFQLQLEQSNATIGQLEETVKGLQEQMSNLGKGGGGGELVSVGDEDFVTGKQFKSLLTAEKQNLDAQFKKVTEQLTQAYAANQDLRMQISEMQVAEIYSTAKVGPELEYFNVIEKGLKKMLIENPGYKAVIARAKNPAMEGYKTGLMHSDFQKIVKAKEIAEFTEKFDKNTKKPKVGGGGGGGSTIDVESMSISDLMKLSDDTLDRLAKRETVV